MALAYAGRYATTRARLADYLRRKIAERGWVEDGTVATDGEVARIVRRFVELGYVDDRAVAEARARSMAARGYGARRLDGVLGSLGIGEQDAEGARRDAAEGAWEAALRFAKRRRIGPFAEREVDDAGRRRAFAAMMRAGHPVDLARRILSASPGDVPSWDDP